jgi:hypothetical protein
MRFLLVLLICAFASCTLLRGYKKRSFEDTDRQRTISLLLPKGFKKETAMVDTSGNRMQTYQYSDGTVFYIAQLRDSLSFQTINEEYHIPKMYPDSVLFYKAADSASGLFWRESKWRNYKVGYKNVSADKEPKFDSAVNHVGWQWARK